MKSILFGLFFTLITASSFSQCDTIRHFTLNDTVFVEGSVYYFNVYYDLHQRGIKGDNNVIFNIIEFLKTNSNLTLQIGSHTDIRPIAMTNDTLSFRRAVQLINHFETEGVDRDRMLPWGYGSTQPYCVQNDTVVMYQKQECFFEKGTMITKEYIESLPDNNTREAAHSLNRRAELKILKIN